MKNKIPKVMKWMLGFLAGIILAEVLYVCIKGCEKIDQGGNVSSLKVEGTILKANGNPVCFKGISFGWHNLWPRFYNAGAVRTLHQEWGFNIFRAAIGADSFALTDNPGFPSGYIDDPDLALEKLFAVVDAAIANECYIIVDWHSHVLHTEEAKAFFEIVATKYAAVPNVIYELFNEPVSTAFESSFDYGGTSEEEYVKYWKQLKEYASSVIEVIKECEKGYEPLILMGCPVWDQRIDLPAADPIEGYDNLMYTVHFYAATHKEYLRERCDAALQAGCPIFISECACCQSSGNGEMDMESWKIWSDWAAARKISMMVWSISDKDETCSMLTKAASSDGHWTDDVIKPWGAVVKNWIAQ